MRNNIKYSKLEENGVEFFGPVEHIPDAQDIAFSDSMYLSDNVKDAVLEGSGVALAAAGFLISMYSGSTSGVGKYLDFLPGTSTADVPAPITVEAKILDLAIRSVGVSTVSVGIYKLVLGVETLIYTAVLNNSSAENYVDLNITLSQGEDLLAKVISGSANRPSVVLTVRRGLV